MKTPDPWHVAATSFGLILATTLPLTFSNLNKIDATQAANIANIQAKILISEELKPINSKLSNISGELKALTAVLGVKN